MLVSVLYKLIWKSVRIFVYYLLLRYERNGILIVDKARDSYSVLRLRALSASNISV